MTRLESLAYAIQTHEGFYSLSRSWRNNNPGNLRSSPFTMKRAQNFAVFGSYMVGWYALVWDLRMKCYGQTRTGLNGNSTLEDLIYVWAPPEDENDSSAYLAAVVKQLNVRADTPLKWFVNKM